MLRTSARLLRLLSLLQARRDWTGADLAGRLEIDVRTLRRDIERLRDLGYPVHAARGVAGGYRLGAGAALPPLLLDDEEAVAVAVGLRTAADGTVAGIEESSVRALVKLEQVLPSRLRHRVNALQEATIGLGGGNPLVDHTTLTAIASACRDHRQLGFGYRGHDGRATARIVEPLKLAHMARRWYLLAWDTGRRDWRTFRVDRMDAPSPRARFTPREPPAADLADYLSRRITTQIYGWRARITVHAPVEQARTRVLPTAGTLSPIDGRTCLLEIGADSLDGLAYLVGLLGFEFEIHEPDELRAHVASLAARLLRGAAPPGEVTGGSPRGRGRGGPGSTGPSPSPTPGR
ncbi:helix-turn-helix transcriptional regulator [Planobispora takensis]|uniref:DNA-binding transcriptional regulator n=1 Tax=Planobispora takensis TaxID=1367882 RepID=A0A8J3SX14_9ACTN|nr:YafY family protein [Planobispora takensis]GIH99894.1 DNA-binding transcriptional regulator [Planobispora takensis]